MMIDIFEWVWDVENRLWDQGREDVADALASISGVATAHEFDELEAIFPLLIGYAREHDLPWLEVYARHWRLQGYLNAGVRLPEMLGEAVSLYARTSEPDVRDCPQSRCAIQDLSLAYGAVDAPGWAAERLAAVEEVLATLDVAVPCSGCLTTELVAALHDLGRSQDAIRHGLAWLEKARAAGVLDAFIEQHFWTDQARGLFDAALSIGDLTLARGVLDKQEPADDEAFLWNAIAKTDLALVEGDANAVRHFPSFARAEARHASHRGRWLRTAIALVRAGQLANDLTLGRHAADVMRTCTENGMRRRAFDAAADAGELAVLRGRKGMARLRLANAERLRTDLKGSHGADERLATLRAAVASLAESTGHEDDEGRLDAALREDDRAAGEAALAALGEPVEAWLELTRSSNNDS